MKLVDQIRSISDNVSKIDKMIEFVSTRIVDVAKFGNHTEKVFTWELFDLCRPSDMEMKCMIAHFKDEGFTVSSNWSRLDDQYYKLYKMPELFYIKFEW